jgi:type I restriction enzyme S subunit
MKNGWQEKPLGTLCEVLDNMRKPVTKRDRVAGQYPYYGATGIQDYVADYLFDEPLVLVGEDGAKWASGENTAFAVEGKCWVNNHAHVLRPCRDAVLDKWLIYHLNHSDLSDFVSGLTVPKLNQGNLREIPVPLPPLPEQRRIVGILDEAFDDIATAKANAEKNLQNARALFESHLNAVFTCRGEGWIEKPLGEGVQEISTGPFGSILHKSDYEHGGIPLVNPINIEGDKIIPDDRKAVGRATAQRLARYALRENDIVIGRRGEIGRCAVVAKEQAGWLCGTGSFIIRPSANTNPYFLSHLLRSEPYRRRLEGVAARATMPSISNDDLASLVVALPPLAQQQRTLKLLESLSTETQSLESIYQQKLDALDELKKSLLHQAFVGKL